MIILYILLPDSRILIGVNNKNYMNPESIMNKENESVHTAVMQKIIERLQSEIYEEENKNVSFIIHIDEINIKEKIF